MPFFHLKLFVVQLICAFAARCCYSLKIINGNVVNITEYPYQVSVQYFDEHYCGGCIIDKNFIVTAAHCTDRKSIYSINVRVGTSFRDQNGQVVYLKAIHQHPKFNELFDFDISLLELEEALVFGDNVQSIGVAESNQEIPYGQVANISGWGTIDPHGNEQSKQLRATQVLILSTSVCKKAYEDEFTPNMICAGYVDGSRDACHGDSGGPLAVNRTLIGIISWGRGCAKREYPGVYASIPALRQFIDQIIH